MPSAQGRDYFLIDDIKDIEIASPTLGENKGLWFFRKTRKTVTSKPFAARGDKGLWFLRHKTRKNCYGVRI